MSGMQIAVRTLMGPQTVTAIALNDTWAVHPMTTVAGEAAGVYAVTHRPTGFCVCEAALPIDTALRIFDAISNITIETTDPNAAAAALKTCGVTDIVARERARAGVPARRMN